MHSDTYRQPDGTVVSEQTQRLAAPVVDDSEAGARRLADAYWRAIRGVTLGLVRVVERGGVVEQRLLGLVPLMRLRPELGPGRASFAIEGGMLAARGGGSLLLAQEPDGDGAVRLRARVEGFRPRLPGLLYAVQSRFHVHVSRRWIGRLAGA